MPKIIILGSGYSCRDYKYKEGDAVWCPYSLYDKRIDKHIDLYFGMHAFEVGKHESMIDLSNYPLTEIIDKYDSAFFTNTVSYMIAYAMFKGITEIEIYGIEMNIEEDYYSQRASVMYWIGYARAHSVKINLASQIDKPPFLYGYEPSKNMKFKLNQLKGWAIDKKEKTEGNQGQQYIGFIQAIDLINKEL